MKYGKWGEFLTQKPYLSDQVIAVCAIKPRYTSLGLRPLLLTQFRLYQMYLSSQSSVLVVILNQAIYQRVLNPYQQPISKKATTTLSFVTIKAFSFVISFISLWTILLSSIQFWSYIEIHELCIPFNYSISITYTFTYSIMWVRIIYWLHILTMTFMKQSWGLVIVPHYA